MSKLPSAILSTASFILFIVLPNLPLSLLDMKILIIIEHVIVIIANIVLVILIISILLISSLH